MEYAIKFIVGLAAFISGWLITSMVLKVIGGHLRNISDMARSDSREEVAKKYWTSVKKEQKNGNI